jgi:hypothetical protein
MMRHGDRELRQVMANRVVAAAALGLLAGSGCVDSGTSSGQHLNSPPVATLEGNVTRGPVPLKVPFTILANDPDGEGLRFEVYSDGKEAAAGTIPAHAGTHPPVIRITYPNPGIHEVRLVVTDRSGGQAADLKVVRALGILDETGNVSAVCGACSGSAVGAPAFLGGNGCLHFVVGTGADCLWYSWTNDMDGFRFRVNSTGDPDVEFRGSCTFSAPTIAFFVGDGDENGNVPAGARCIIVWSYRQAPTAITTQIWR